MVAIRPGEIHNQFDTTSDPPYRGPAHASQSQPQPLQQAAKPDDSVSEMPCPLAQRAKALQNAAGMPTASLPFARDMHERLTLDVSTEHQGRRIRYQGVAANGGCMLVDAVGRAAVQLGPCTRFEVVARGVKKQVISLAAQVARSRHDAPLAILNLVQGLTTMMHELPPLNEEPDLHGRLLAEACSEASALFAPKREVIFADPVQQARQLGVERDHHRTQWVALYISDDLMDAIADAATAASKDSSTAEKKRLVIAPLAQLNDMAEKLSVKLTREMIDCGKPSGDPPMRYSMTRFMPHVMRWHAGQVYTTSHALAGATLGARDPHTAVSGAPGDFVLSGHDISAVTRTYIDERVFQTATDCCGLSMDGALRFVRHLPLLSAARASIEGQDGMHHNSVGWKTYPVAAISYGNAAWILAHFPVAQELAATSATDGSGSLLAQLQTSAMQRSTQTLAEKFPEFARAFATHLLSTRELSLLTLQRSSAQNLQSMAPAAGKTTLAEVFMQTGLSDVTALQKCVSAFIGSPLHARLPDRLPPVLAFTSECEADLVHQWLCLDDARAMRVARTLVGRAERLLEAELAKAAASMGHSADVMAVHDTMRSVLHQVMHLDAQTPGHIDGEIEAALESLRAPLSRLCDSKTVPPAQFYEFVYAAVFNMPVQEHAHAGTTDGEGAFLLGPDPWGPHSGAAPRSLRWVVDKWLAGDKSATVFAAEDQNAGFTVAQQIMELVVHQATIRGRVLEHGERLEENHTRVEGYTYHATPARFRGMGTDCILDKAQAFARWLHQYGDVSSSYAMLRDSTPNTALYYESANDPAGRTNRGATSLILKSTTVDFDRAMWYARGMFKGGSGQRPMVTLLRPGFYLDTHRHVRPGEGNLDREYVDPGVLPAQAIVSIFGETLSADTPDLEHQAVKIEGVVWHNCADQAVLEGLGFDQLNMLVRAVQWNNARIDGQPEPAPLHINDDAVQKVCWEDSLSHNRRPHDVCGYVASRHHDHMHRVVESPAVRQSRLLDKQEALRKITRTVRVHCDTRGRRSLEVVTAAARRLSQQAASANMTK